MPFCLKPEINSSGKGHGQTKSKILKKTKTVPQRGNPLQQQFFKKIGWTMAFLFRPADPIHNPFKVRCYNYGSIFTIKAEGTVEILRHHRIKTYLRRDQRWRYEHTMSVDPGRMTPWEDPLQDQARCRTAEVNSHGIRRYGKEIPILFHEGSRHRSHHSRIAG